MNNQNLLPFKSNNRRKRGNKKHETISTHSLIYNNLVKPIIAIKPTAIIKPIIKIQIEIPIANNNNNNSNSNILEIDLTIEEAIIQRNRAIMEEYQVRNGENQMIIATNEPEIIEID